MWCCNNDFVRKDLYNGKTKNIEAKIRDINHSATNACLNAKINEIEGEIRSISNLATTATLITVENKVPSVSNLVKKANYNTKSSETGEKITDHGRSDKYITTPEFNKTTVENFAARINK